MHANETVAIIGAGPYGLAAAAHLRAAGIAPRVFGEPMSFWDEQMPRGMLLRSAWEASQIAVPGDALTLDAYRATGEAALGDPVPVDGFVSYGRWVARQVAPDLDPRRVRTVQAADAGFRLTLADGEPVAAGRVVVATGIAPFVYRPRLYEAMPHSLVTHSSEHRDFDRFRNQRVLVVGGGQAALESAALLHEAGAAVEVVTRAPALHFLRGGRLRRTLGPAARLLYPPTDVGPPGLNWIVALPDHYRRLPRTVQDRIYRRSVRPAGAGWLVPRLRDVPLTTGRSVVAVREGNGAAWLRLDDGAERTVDAVILATGYRVDVRRYPFLTSALLRGLRTVNGYPVLRSGLESSVPGLHMLGAPAGYSFGPVARFVSGTGYTGRALARHISGRTTLRPALAAPRRTSVGRDAA